MVPGDGTVYLGATNDLALSPESSATTGMTHFLMTCALEQLDRGLFSSRILQLHVGNRPASIDGFPLIGRVWQDNVWVLSGTYRDGFHCSPLLARHLAELLLGGGGLLGDHSFEPLRRPLVTMSREEAIDEVALHAVAQLYEFSGKPPTYMKLAESVERQTRERTQATYEKLGTHMGLAPEVLGVLNWGPDREENMRYFRSYLARLS
ncbi:FAD-binding oxidoreductase [Streptacidiphilus sp. 4-A2]|nr:FAD-binding oxidoreductase [Streptacidiphilus sp. 4-A2]